MLIFIAEQDQDLRLGLQILLHQEPGMHVVGMAIETDGLLVQLQASRADLILLDWHLPGASTEHLLGQIKRLEPQRAVVVLSVKPEEEGPALAAGADAFISKNAPPDNLLNVIRSMKHTADQRS